LLVFAHKQDWPNAITPAELTEYLGLASEKRNWKVQPSSFANGLEEGFEWLSSTMKYL
jgi:hypothetical protein